MKIVEVDVSGMQAVYAKVKLTPKLSSMVAIVFLLVGCTTSQDNINGPVQASLIHAIPGNHCKFDLQATTLTTLQGLNPLRGGLGQVVRSDEVFDYDENPEKFEQMLGLFPMDTFFTKRAGKIYPLDYSSLAALSIYGFLDQVHSLFKNTDAGADLMALVPDSAYTKLVYQAKRYVQTKTGQKYDSDNASYYYIPLEDGGARNYLMIYPADEAAVPLGLNPFVVAHESGHFVSRHLWRKHFQITTQSALNVIDSIDEGIGDYVGYMITRDAGGFLCSFPDESVRDMGQWKTINSLKQKFGSDRFQLSSSSFPEHYGGAVFAAIQYQIGQIVGHEENFRALVKGLQNLSSCAGSNPTFSSVGSCHTKYLRSGQSQAQQLYSTGFAGLE